MRKCKLYKTTSAQSCHNEFDSEWRKYKYDTNDMALDMVFIVDARQFSIVRDEKKLGCNEIQYGGEMKEERTCYQNLGQFIVTGTK